MEQIENGSYQLGFYIQQAAIPATAGLLVSTALQCISWEVAVLTGATDIIFDIAKKILSESSTISDLINHYNLYAHHIIVLKAASYLICGISVCSLGVLLGLQSIEISSMLLLTIAAAIGRFANQKLAEKQRANYNPESAENLKIREELKSAKIKMQKAEATLEQRQLEFLQKELTLKVSLDELRANEEKANQLLQKAEEKELILEGAKKAFEQEKRLVEQNRRHQLLESPY